MKGLPWSARTWSTAGSRHPLAQAARSQAARNWGAGRLAHFRGDRYDHGSGESVRAATAPRDERLARLEAALFVSREPQSLRKLAQLANLADGTEARTLVRQLNRYYDASACAFRVEEVAGGYRLLTRPQFGAWLRRLHRTPVETRLSAPALETLAVVAYRQPVVRAGIEAIRGVQCGEILRQLMDRDLLRIVGRSSELGRPLLYGTTKRFLEVFGLKGLDELPRAAELRVAATSAAGPPSHNMTSDTP